VSTTIKKGAVFEDRDPRADGRRVVVLVAPRGQSWAWCASTNGRKSSIKRSRLLNPRLFSPVTP
jgi:hypothetical protein